MIKVYNMQSAKGNYIPNQFIICDAKGAKYFQSYSTIIVKKTMGGKVFLDASSWDYSRTTGKYRNLFLGEDKKRTQRKIDLGIYKLVNLNEDNV